MELELISRDLVHQIKSIIEQARRNVAVAVNQELICSNWRIGKLIVDSEQSNSMNDITARSFILSLSKELTAELGKGFSRSNLYNMRSFYMYYSDVQTLSEHISMYIVVVSRQR